MGARDPQADSLSRPARVACAHPVPGVPGLGKPVWRR